MTFGKKLKRVREFRKLTQKQLGIALGYKESNAGVRIRHYELDLKRMSNETVMRAAEFLDVSYACLKGDVPGSVEDAIQTLFWLEESNPKLVKPLKLNKISRNTQAGPNPEHRENDISVNYHEGDYWPDFVPVCIWFNHELTNEFMNEWATRKRDFDSDKITKKEYLEWKFNWPRSSEAHGKEPEHSWRNKNKEE